MVSGFELGLSPPSFNISFNQGDEYCDSFKVFSDRKTKVYIEDLWSDKNTRDLKDYVYSSEHFEINFEYENSLIVDNRANGEYCILADNYGEYNGLLLVKDESLKAGVGMWINLEVLGGKKGITGFTVRDVEGVGFIGLLVFQGILFLILISLFILLVRRKRLSN